MFTSIPNEVRDVRATESILDRLYRAANKGMKGDSLALAAGLLPLEFRRLCQCDPQVELMVMKGKADSELEHASLLAEASRNGDAKASLAILQNVHGWVAKQQVEVTNTTTISLKTLLDERDRIIQGNIYESVGQPVVDTATDDEPRAVLLPTEIRDVGVLMGGGRPQEFQGAEEVAVRRDEGNGNLRPRRPRSVRAEQNTA
jgi:hypothetical protein